MTGGDHKLICLGGTLCDERVFTPLLNALPVPASTWSYSNDDRVDHAAAALLSAQRQPFVALGFSLGGFVALEALRLAPEQVAAVILLSGNAFPDDSANADMRRADVAAARAIGLRQFIMERKAQLVSASCESFDDTVDMIANMAETLGSDVHARQTEMNIHRPDLRPVVTASSRPILAIVGADDVVCPPNRYLDLRHAANVTLRSIDGAGHFLPLEAPGECARLITQFMKDLVP